jgi:outer membrane scaffolding protein for murein synthesis (MipA/OmpV family)
MGRLATSSFALALGISLLAAGALAADVGDGGYKDGGEPVSDWTVTGITVGGILIVQPEYEGSDEYEAVGFPYLFPNFADSGPGFFSRVEANGLDDIRFRLIERDGFFAGPLAGYQFGREENDGDLLEGLGDIDDSFVAGGFVGYQWAWFQADVSFHHFFGDTDGYQIRFGLQAERRVSERVKLTARVGANYADENYTQVNFGITDEQALASPIFAEAFEADAGFKDVYGQLGVKVDLDEHWSARASLRYSRLVGDAADSPVIETEDQFTGLFGLSYRFDTSGFSR